MTGTSADEVLAGDFWRWGDLHPAVDAVARGSRRHKEGISKSNRTCPENALQRAVLQRRCASHDDERSR